MGIKAPLQLSPHAPTTGVPGRAIFKKHRDFVVPDHDAAQERSTRSNIPFSFDKISIGPRNVPAPQSPIIARAQRYEHARERTTQAVADTPNLAARLFRQNRPPGPSPLAPLPDVTVTRVPMGTNQRVPPRMQGSGAMSQAHGSTIGAAPSPLVQRKEPEGKEAQGKEPEAKEAQGKEPEAKEAQGKETQGKEAASRPWHEPFIEAITTILDFLWQAIQAVLGVIVGVVHGIASFIWGMTFGLLWDIIKAIGYLIGSLIHGISYLVHLLFGTPTILDGAWQGVKEFFTGLFFAIQHPLLTMQLAWNDFTQKVKATESTFGKVELVVSTSVETILNVVTVVKAAKNLVAKAAQQGPKVLKDAHLSKSAQAEALKSADEAKGFSKQLAEESKEAADALKQKKPPSKRIQYMGKNPSKDSATGKAVIQRMRNEGLIKEVKPGKLSVYHKPTKKWYPIEECDMGHRIDAVKYWNAQGKHHGPKSREVREWMKDPNNYELEPKSINRSNGAKLTDRYDDPVNN